MRSSCYDRSPGKSRCNPCIIDIPFIGICERLAKILSELCRVKIQARQVCPGAPWIISKKDLEAEAIKKAACSKLPKRPFAGNAKQKVLNFQ